MWHDGGLPVLVNYLKKLVESYGLEERIKFFGNKEGIELDNLFNESDLGIGTMAIHRKKVKYSSSLKHREYVLRGIPLLLSGEDRGLLNYEEIILKVEENDSPIDIYNLISKFNVLNSNYVENSLRRKAEKDLGWEGQLRKVLESF